MKHFINLKDIPSADLKKIIIDAKNRKQKRKNSVFLQILIIYPNMSIDKFLK